MRHGVRLLGAATLIGLTARSLPAAARPVARLRPASALRPATTPRACVVPSSPPAAPRASLATPSNRLPTTRWARSSSWPTPLRTSTPASPPSRCRRAATTSAASSSSGSRTRDAIARLCPTSSCSRSSGARGQRGRQHREARWHRGRLDRVGRHLRLGDLVPGRRADLLIGADARRAHAVRHRGHQGGLTHACSRLARTLAVSVGVAALVVGCSGSSGGTSDGVAPSSSTPTQGPSIDPSPSGSGVPDGPPAPEVKGYTIAKAPDAARAPSRTS